MVNEGFRARELINAKALIPRPKRPGEGVADQSGRLTRRRGLGPEWSVYPAKGSQTGVVCLSGEGVADRSGLSIRRRGRGPEWSVYPAKGSRTRIVSLRSGLVDNRATGASINSSTRRMYLTAVAGRSAQERAPMVLSCQPSRVS